MVTDFQNSLSNNDDDDDDDDNNNNNKKKKKKKKIYNAHSHTLSINCRRGQVTRWPDGVC